MIYYIDANNKIDLDLLDKVVLFIWDHLGLPDDIDLEIDFEGMEDHLYGDVDVEKNTATITLNTDIPSDEIIPTLFHESVHIKQIINGDLILGEGNNSTIWRGSIYNEKYDMLPWEVEAFNEEGEMCAMFYSKYGVKV